jgi:hypothetical protein
MEGVIPETPRRCGAASFGRPLRQIPPRSSRLSSQKRISDPIVDPIIGRYAKGEISAVTAAALLGDDFSVSDVFLMLLAAGFEPPQPPPERALAELRHAERVLGLPVMP